MTSTISTWPIALFGTLALSTTAAKGAEPVPNWIGGSYVNVRETASKTAPILDRLIINTPVTLLAQSDGVCEILWDAKKKGFVACHLLRSKPVVLQDVGERLPDGAPNPNYSPLRAFWLQPTFDRLINVAVLFEGTMLSKKQSALEEEMVSTGRLTGGFSVGPAKRYAIPEFEAMKALLAKGVVAPHALWTSPPKWESVSTDLSLETKGAQLPLPGLDSLHRWVYRQIKLGPTRPSYFKTMNDIGRPKATPEELSAQFGIPWQLEVKGKSVWGGNSNSGPVRNGVWDIGAVTQRLERPVYAIAVSNTGAVAIAKTQADFDAIAGGDNEDCAGSPHIQWPKKDQLPNYSVFDGAFTLFRASHPLNIAKAKVTIKRQRLSPPKQLEGEEYEGRPKYSRATITYIDLDIDGENDIAVWDAVNTQVGAGDGPEGSEYHSKLIFVNVNGAWFLLDFDEDDAPCGC